MRVTMLWYGGSNYAAPDPVRDVEQFDSLRACREAFENRADFDPYYPCVESPEAHVFIGHHDDLTDAYPDRILTLGKRGAVLTRN